MMIRSVNIRHIDIILVSILLLTALFFRLWRLESFQYWSDDDQILWAIIHHIAIDKHPSLVVPNSAIGGSLGPLYHYLLAPWFWLVDFKPEKILLLGNLFTLANVAIIYTAGKIIAGRKVGLIAGFLYATSFMSLLFDHRIWALSPSVLLISTGVIALVKILKGESKYLLLLALPWIFSFNSDPSLGLITLASIIIFLLFRPKLEKRYIIRSLIVIFIFLLPLILFEIRHQGQNVKSITQFLSGQVVREDIERTRKENFLKLQVDYFSRFFYTPPTDSADAYFCYCEPEDNTPILVTLITGVILLAFFVFTVVTRDRNYIVLLTILLSYLLGIYLFREILEGNPTFMYSIVVSPILFLITAVIISKNKYLASAILLILLLLNSKSTYQSSFKYPLRERLDLVQEIITKLSPKQDFSLYYSGDVLLAGGGWTALFWSKGYVPSKGTLSLYWRHLFESYDLYPIPFSNRDPAQVVILSENELGGKDNPFVLDTVQRGRAYSVIYNNNKQWFIPEVYLEKLYQPDYFD